MKRVLLTFGILIFESLLVVSDINAESRREVVVSAAMSLKSAFEELGKQYEAGHKGVKMMFNFGASGDLTRQIEGGAPVDVFASAAQKYMDELERKGYIIPGSRKDFASNAVVLVLPLNSPLRVNSFTDLSSHAIKRISVGNFKTVPAGRYAEEVFQFYKILPAIKNKLIFAENVRQVLDYVARKEVDAGVVYATDVLVRAKDVLVAATAPGESHKPVIYPIALVKGTKNEELTKGFIDFVISTDGQRILKKYGFGILKKK